MIFFHRYFKTATYFIRGHQLCFEGWRKLLNITAYMVSKALKLFAIGLTSTVDTTMSSCGSMRKPRASSKREMTRAWMRSYFGTYGEKMPHKSEVHLPSFLTKQRLYKAMVDGINAYSNILLSRTSFLRLWKEEFDHVVIPPVKIIGYN